MMGDRLVSGFLHLSLILSLIFA